MFLILHLITIPLKSSARASQTHVWGKAIFRWLRFHSFQFSDFTKPNTEKKRNRKLRTSIAFEAQTLLILAPFPFRFLHRRRRYDRRPIRSQNRRRRRWKEAICASLCRCWPSIFRFRRGLGTRNPRSDSPSLRRDRWIRDAGGCFRHLLLEPPRRRSHQSPLSRRCRVILSIGLSLWMRWSW